MSRRTDDFMEKHHCAVWDAHWSGYELARDVGHRYIWLWHGFNIRLIAVPHGVHGYDYGWCYPRDPDVVVAAVAAWDSGTQDEPAGWHKRPGNGVRRAPRRDAQPGYNRPRCVHGCYIHEGCRTVGCPETEGQ